MPSCTQVNLFVTCFLIWWWATPLVPGVTADRRPLFGLNRATQFILCLQLLFEGVPRLIHLHVNHIGHLATQNGGAGQGGWQGYQGGGGRVELVGVMLMVVIDQVAKVPHQETKGAQNYSNRASHLFNFFFLILRFKKEEQSVKKSVLESTVLCGKRF